MKPSNIAALVGLAVVMAGIYCSYKWADSNESPAEIVLGLTAAELETRSGKVAHVQALPTADESINSKTAEDEHRDVAEHATVSDFEVTYYRKTRPELEARSSELNEMILIAASNHAELLINAGMFERVDQHALQEKEKADKEASRGEGRRYARKAQRIMADGSTEYGWIEFRFLDEVATASLERERNFVRQRSEELRLAAKRKY